MMKKNRSQYMAFGSRKSASKEAKIVSYFLTGGTGSCCSCMGCSEDGDLSYPQGATRERCLCCGFFRYLIFCHCCRLGWGGVKELLMAMI